MVTMALALLWMRKIWPRLFFVAWLAWGLSSGSLRAADLSGRWEGEWQSCTDRFHGTVNAQITRCGPGRYEAIFTGRAFKIMPYRYKSTLFAWTDATTGVTHFKSAHRIPLWGCHWMSGTAQGNCFHAKYRTDDHTGYFAMRRVK